MGARAAGLAVTALAVLSACGPGRRGFPSPPEGLLRSRDAVTAGERIYERDCAICHGRSAHGDGPQGRSLTPPPADLRSLRGVRAEPGYWFYRIKYGGKKEPLARPGSAMPAWGDHLSDEDIWQVVAYLRSLVEEAA